MTHLVNVVKVLQEEDIEVKSAEPVKPVEKQEDCFTEVSGLLRKKYKNTHGKFRFQPQILNYKLAKLS